MSRTKAAGMMKTTANAHLDDGLCDEGVEVRHQFAVDVGHVQVLRDDGDEAHCPIPDPHVGVTQERSYRGHEGQITTSNIVTAQDPV